NVGYDIRIISNSITNLVCPTLKTLSLANTNNSSSSHIIILNNARLSEIEFPILQAIGNTTSTCPPAMFPTAYLTISITNNNLNSKAVDNLLQDFANLDVPLRCRRIIIQQPAPFNAAPPSLEGDIWKQKLLANNNLIYTD
ncbi:MAG: hypothetical protein ACOVQE_01565, partial [Chitinophagaceae bacterium]